MISVIGPEKTSVIHTFNFKDLNSSTSLALISIIYAEFHKEFNKDFVRHIQYGDS